MKVGGDPLDFIRKYKKIKIMFGMTWDFHFWVNYIFKILDLVFFFVRPLSLQYIHLILFILNYLLGMCETSDSSAVISKHIEECFTLQK